MLLASCRAVMMSLQGVLASHGRPFVTGFAVCRGPRAPCLAASLRNGVFAEGLPPLKGRGALVLELAVSAARALVLEAAGERGASRQRRAQ
jgi:hypothetical protein